MPLHLLNWGKHDEAPIDSPTHFKMADFGLSSRPMRRNVIPEGQLLGINDLPRCSTRSQCQLASQARRAIKRVRDCNMLYTLEEQEFIQ